VIPQPEYRRIELEDIVVSSDGYLNDNAAGVVIFTSGTTGKPKGAVLRRAYIHDTASTIADGYQLSPSDRLLHVLPVHHATGLGTSFSPYLNVGACIEFRTGGGFDAGWTWDRFRIGGITSFSTVPTILLRLMWHYRKVIMKLPHCERSEYDEAVRSIRTIACGSSALQQPVQDFRTTLRRGQPILVRYGSSEIPAAIRVSADTDFSQVPKGSVELANPGVDVKIADSGELLIKSPFMFSW
jgi:malonyl-CoA/methylmalonyl-CoA synthetase